MREIILSACALAAAAGSALAQGGTVEFRIVELNNQTIVSSPALPAPNNDAVLNFAVQARVTQVAGRGIGDWSFNIRIAGEAESAANGTLARLRTSQSDGTYFTGAPSTSATGGGLLGVASAYRYLVGLNSNFNGLINGNGGTFTNGPDQEIGLVAGTARGAGLSNAGLVIDDPNNPGTNIAAPEPDFTTALNAFFGSNGNWIDLYRFRYTVASFAQRTLDFRIEAATAATFSSLVPAGADFSGNTTGGAAQTSVAGVSIPVVPAPASVALVGLGGLALARRRR
ncbi:MAG: PEP-CTERM sorting domain-containing protein [Phycisphaerales bacterium]|nr:PEP-CTERM sorting domain-containing protein [Phycisphaerales bacterium]